jgi:hypothetical protein
MTADLILSRVPVHHRTIFREAKYDSLLSRIPFTHYFQFTCYPLTSLYHISEQFALDLLTTSNFTDNNV